MKKFILFIISGALICTLGNYFEYFSIPEAPFLIGLCLGAIAWVAWPIILLLGKLVYELTSVVFASAYTMIVAIFWIIYIPISFVTVMFVGLILILFVPGTKIEMPTKASKIFKKQTKPKPPDIK